MGESKLKGCAEIIAALGGARGLLLIITALSSLTFGKCQWNRAAQAEVQRDNVIEGTKILTQQPVVTQSDCCDELKREIHVIKNTIKEWHE